MPILQLSAIKALSDDAAREYGEVSATRDVTAARGLFTTADPRSAGKDRFYGMHKCQHRNLRIDCRDASECAARASSDAGLLKRLTLEPLDQAGGPVSARKTPAVNLDASFSNIWRNLDFRRQWVHSKHARAGGGSSSI